MERKRILVVDDSKTALMVETMALRRSAYDLLTAASGEEALSLAARERPDLVLLDMVMPKMDGLETCRRLRSDPVTRDVPIIIVTTRGEPANVEAGYSSGCNDYVTKPIDGAVLLAKIDSLLRQA